MNREIKIIEVNGHKIELKTYLSYDESEAALKIENKFDQTSELIKAAVVSLDGDVKDAYARIRALPLPVYSAVAVKVTEIITEGFPKEK